MSRAMYTGSIDVHPLLMEVYREVPLSLRNRSEPGTSASKIEVDYRQSGPRPDPRLLRQAALEALTRSARTNTPRKTRPEQFPAKRRRRRAAEGGARRRRREVLDLDRPNGPGSNDEHSVHLHHRDFTVTPIADQIGPIDSVSETEYYDLKNHFSEPQCKKTLLPLNSGKPRTCVTLNGSGIQLAVGPQPLWLRNHNPGLAQRIMVKRLAKSPHDPLGITDSACKNQSVMVSVQYGPFNPYIPIRSTTIGKSRVAIDPIAMHTSWRSNSDITSVTRTGIYQPMLHSIQLDYLKNLQRPITDQNSPKIGKRTRSNLSTKSTHKTAIPKTCNISSHDMHEVAKEQSVIKTNNSAGKQWSLNTTHNQSAGENHRSEIFWCDNRSTITAKCSNPYLNLAANTSTDLADTAPIVCSNLLPHHLTAKHNRNCSKLKFKAVKKRKNYWSTIAKIFELCNYFVLPQHVDLGLQTSINRKILKRRAQLHQSCSKWRRKSTEIDGEGFE
ncbi:exportin 1 [Dorcoceras hygrometricum]|uniref:Exportin 1 n=1 Tax=Dorcoceras hygrometricum TaxID=472368 RepID=A0A2Z7CQT2_9LAMI|nr:exportin 1 [Dorcoceras hygrometricum]